MDRGPFVLVEGIFNPMEHQLRVSLTEQGAASVVLLARHTEGGQQQIRGLCK